MSSGEQNLAAQLRDLADRPDMMKAVHLAVEDELIDLRDRGIFTIHANGLVCRDKDGRDSYIVRIGTGPAIQQILRILADKLDAEDNS
jgi:hypothetical protein